VGLSLASNLKSHRKQNAFNQIARKAGCNGLIALRRNAFVLESSVEALNLGAVMKREHKLEV